jgi:hypothetical protein
MNAMNLTSVKVAVCGVVALALTVGFSSTFVMSTSMARVVMSAPTHMVANVGTHLAQSTVTGLLQ